MIKTGRMENKSKCDANFLLGVSLAVCKAGAIENKVLLYLHIAVLADNFEVIV